MSVLSYRSSNIHFNLEKTEIVVQPVEFIVPSSVVQAGGKVNISAGGATPLHIAADNGSAEIINCLLKAGADPNATDEVKVTTVATSHIKFLVAISCLALQK